jgi:hypothetical protein
MLLKRLAKSLSPYQAELISTLGSSFPNPNSRSCLDSLTARTYELEERGIADVYVEAAGILTTENILLTPFHTLQSKVAIPDHLLNELIDQCLFHTAPPILSASDFSSNKEATKSGIWGLGALDGIFDGWDGVGIMELAGSKRSGKSVCLLIPLSQLPLKASLTQVLALHAVLMVLLEDERAKCRWLDTEGSFSPLRAQAILAALGIKVCRTLELHELMFAGCEFHTWEVGCFALFPP